MTKKPDRLYLIGVGYRTVTIIPAIDALDAINAYLVRIGFNGYYRYFCSRLMTTAITVNTRMNNISKYCYIAANIKSIGCDILNISSQLVANCADIFALVDFKDINSPSFMRPTIEEVRNCVGFRREPMCKLRKFCR